MPRTVKVPLVGVSDDAQRELPDHQVSGVGAEPNTSHQFLVLSLDHHHVDGMYRQQEDSLAFGLSLEAAAVLHRELRKALNACLVDPLEETE